MCIRWTGHTGFTSSQSFNSTCTGTILPCFIIEYNFFSTYREIKGAEPNSDTVINGLHLIIRERYQSSYDRGFKKKTGIRNSSSVNIEYYF